jgi:hypothetical protein
MTRCSKCQVPYPSHLINPVVVGESNGTVKALNLCPECGLEKMNALYGQNRKQYSPGSASQALLEEARLFKGAPKS